MKSDEGPMFGRKGEAIEVSVPKASTSNAQCAPLHTTWQQRRRRRKVAYERVITLLFVLLAVTVGIYFSVLLHLVAPAFVQ